LGRRAIAWAEEPFRKSEDRPKKIPSIRKSYFLGWGSHSWAGEAILGLGKPFLGWGAISWEEELFLGRKNLILGRKNLFLGSKSYCLGRRAISWVEDPVSWVEELLLGSKSYFLGRTAFHLPFFCSLPRYIFKMI
jgi:hypothetical protein